MKRDMELIRSLLAEIESTPAGGWYDTESSSLSADIETLGEHLLLLEEAGYIRSVDQDRSGHATCRGLTWAGHEFLAALRSDTIWQKCKAMLREKALSVAGVPLQVIQELCVAVARSELGLG